MREPTRSPSAIVLRETLDQPSTPPEERWLFRPQWPGEVLPIVHTVDGTTWMRGRPEGAHAAVGLPLVWGGAPVWSGLLQAERLRSGWHRPPHRGVPAHLLADLVWPFTCQMEMWQHPLEVAPGGWPKAIEGLYDYTRKLGIIVGLDQGRRVMWDGLSYVSLLQVRQDISPRPGLGRP